MRRHAIFGAGAALCAAATGGVGAARADGGQDTAVAEALFQDGRTLLAQGRTSEACGKFASSQRIDPQIGTMMFLATCHEAEGRTATAWGEFNAALAAIRRGPEGPPGGLAAADARREAYAQQRLEALATKLSRLILTAASPPPGLEVQLDAQSLGAGTLGTPLPVDAGLHTIVATAPLRRPWSTSVQVADGPIDVELTIPPLEPLSRSAVSVPLPAPSLAAEAQAPPAATHAISTPAGAGLRPDRTLAYVAGGIGIAGLVVGTVAGSWAIADKDRADGGPCSGKFCTQHGLDLYSEASTAAWVSTGGFVVAALGLAVGAGALLLSPPSKSAATSLRVTPTLGGAGAAISASW
jgi:hypothetical protein